MDPKLFKVELQENPSEDQYIFWKSMILKYLRRLNISEEDQIDIRLLSCGASTFSCLSDCCSVSEAINRLDSKFLKKSTGLLIRQKLRCRKQGENESIQEFVSELKKISKTVPITQITVDLYRDLLVSDSFISGINSSTIRQRILEMPDSPLSDIINVATTMEMAKEDKEKLSLSFDRSICAARSKPSIDRDKFLKCACCGKNKHE